MVLWVPCTLKACLYSCEMALRFEELLEKSVSIMECSFGSEHYNVGVILAA